jgi:hypothetical protein
MSYECKIAYFLRYSIKSLDQHRLAELRQGISIRKRESKGIQNRIGQNYWKIKESKIRKIKKSKYPERKITAGAG